MKWFLIICCLCSLALSLFACFTVGTHPNADMYAVIIAVLTLLVTILIGWQIYNAIELSRKIKEMQRIASKAAYDENKKYNHTTIAIVHYINALDFYKHQRISKKAVDELFKCIEEALKGRFQFPIDMAINYMLSIPKTDFFVSKIKKREYIRILYYINNEQAKELITKIESAYEN